MLRIHLNENDDDARENRHFGISRRAIHLFVRVAVAAGIVMALLAIPYPSENELRQQYESLSPQSRQQVDDSVIRRSDLTVEQTTELGQLKACREAAPACVLTAQQLARMRELEDRQLSQEIKRYQSKQGTFDPLE